MDILRGLRTLMRGGGFLLVLEVATAATAVVAGVAGVAAVVAVAIVAIANKIRQRQSIVQKQTIR